MQAKAYHASIFYRMREKLHPLLQGGQLKTGRNVHTAEDLGKLMTSVMDACEFCIHRPAARVEFEDAVRRGRCAPPLDEVIAVALSRAFLLEYLLPVRVQCTTQERGHTEVASSSP